MGAVAQLTGAQERVADRAGSARMARRNSRRSAGGYEVEPSTSDNCDETYFPRCADHVYRLLIERATEGALLVSGQGAVVWVNARICEILTMPSERLLGTPFTALLEQRSLATYRQLTEWVATPSSAVALTLIAADGRRVPVRVSASRLPIDGEAGTGLLITDLSVEAAAEAAVTLQARLLDATADAIVARDPEGRITYVNAAAERLYGWRQDEVIGRSWSEVAMAPELADNAELIRQTVNSGGTWSGEFQVDRADGTSLWVHISGSAMFDGNGELSAIIVAATDVTDRRLVQQELTVRERRFRALVAGSSDLIAAVRADATLTYANPAATRILGFDPAEQAGRSMLELVHPDDLEATAAIFARGLARPGATNESATFRFRTSDGEWRVLEAVSTNCLDDPAIGAVVVNARDVTDYVRTARARDTLSRAGELLVHACDETSLLAEMCRAITEVGGYDIAWIGRPEHDREWTVRPVAASGRVEALDDLHISWGDNCHGRGVTGMAMRTGSVQVINDSRTAAPTFAPWQKVAATHDIRAVCAIPLELTGEVWALTIYASQPGVFDPDSLAVLEKLGQELVYGIGRLRDADRLTRSMRDTVAAVAATIEHRDPYTAGHQRRVAQLAAAIARQMGLDAERTQGIAIGATVHDIGKISMPAEILVRPGRLSAAEFELIKTHTTAGAEILAGIEFPWPVADIVHHHHERFDGSGYPDGLGGEEISLEARIVAVADVVEAMSAHRPYRPALGMPAALAEIAAGSGTRYDPQVADACLAVLHRGFSFDDTPEEKRWISPDSRPRAPHTGPCADASAARSPSGSSRLPDPSVPITT